MKINMVQNSLFQWRIELQASGQPVDIEGAEVFMQVRALSSNALMADLSDYATVSDIEQGVIEIDAPASATANLKERTQARYDVVLQMPDGDLWRVISGMVHVTAAVTEVA